MRVFLAIDLPEEVKYAIAKTIFSKNLHITLHFFGDVSNVSEIKAKLSRI